MVRKPPRHRRSFALACLAALAVGCTQRIPPTSVHLARAFAELCNTLETHAVTARAAEYAYSPAQPSGRFATVPVTGSRSRIVSWTRDDGLARSTLSWDETARKCELAVGGVEATIAEGAFVILVATWATEGRQATKLVTPKPRNAGLNTRRAMRIGPPPFAPGSARILQLRTDDRPDRPIQATISLQPTGTVSHLADDAAAIH